MPRAIWPIAIVLIAVVIVARLGWVAIARYRRGMLDSSEKASGWSLEDLEGMRDSGQITDQEFRILRDQVMRRFTTSGRNNTAGKPSFPAKPNDKIDK